MTKESLSFKTHIAFHDKLRMHYLFISEKNVKKLGGKICIRLLCSINGTPAFQCGLVSLGNGNAYIMLSKIRMKQCGIELSQEIKLTLQKDNSKYGMQMPEELKELLKQDAEGNMRFEKLTPGKQRYIIHYVDGVKNTQKRIDRAIMLIENLKLSLPGKEDFRDILGIKD